MIHRRNRRSGKGSSCGDFHILRTRRSGRRFRSRSLRGLCGRLRSRTMIHSSRVHSAAPCAERRQRSMGWRRRPQARRRSGRDWRNSRRHRRRRSHGSNRLNARRYWCGLCCGRRSGRFRRLLMMRGRRRCRRLGKRGHLPPQFHQLAVQRVVLLRRVLRKLFQFAAELALPHYRVNGQKRSG